MKPSNPRAFHAARTRSAAARLSASASTQPPPPAPVTFAPSAPDFRAQAHRSSIDGVDSDSVASSRWFSSRSSPRLGPSPDSSDARTALTTWRIARNVVSTATRRSALWRATRSTITRVRDAIPERPTANTNGAPVMMGSALLRPSSRTNWTTPPSVATAASMPEGLPWNTRSQHIACSRTTSSLASGASARAIATPSAAEQPRPSPAGSSVVTSTRVGATSPRVRTASSSARKARESSSSPLSVTSADHAVTCRRLGPDGSRYARATAPRSIPSATAGTP